MGAVSGNRCQGAEEPHSGSREPGVETEIKRREPERPMTRTRERDQEAWP